MRCVSRFQSASTHITASLAQCTDPATENSSSYPHRYELICLQKLDMDLPLSKGKKQMTSPNKQLHVNVACKWEHEQPWMQIRNISHSKHPCSDCDRVLCCNWCCSVIVIQSTTIPIVNKPPNTLDDIDIPTCFFSVNCFISFILSPVPNTWGNGEWEKSCFSHWISCFTLLGWTWNSHCEGFLLYYLPCKQPGRIKIGQYYLPRDFPTWFFSVIYLTK